jgi:peptide deformylase
VAVRPVLKMGDPLLLRKAEPVSAFDTDDLRSLISDMFDTMEAANGAGLAAPQIGVSWRVVIFGLDANPRYPDAEPVPTTVLINPRIQVLGDEIEDGWEGCLSVPGLRGLVPRASHIRYQGFDPTGRRIDREVAGFHARVVQHECDHLDGILYPMRIRDMRQFGFENVLFPEFAPEPERSESS